MFKGFTILLTVLISITTFAQSSEMGQLNNTRKTSGGYFFRVDASEKISNEDIDGSPFLYENFTYGKIIDLSQDKTIEALMRYDVYQDRFEIMVADDSENIKVLKRSNNYEYVLNREKFVLIQSEEAINEIHYNVGNGYVVELTSPENSEAALYKRYSKKLIQGKKAKTTYQQDTPPKIENDVRYIIKFGDEFVRVEDHKRKILDAFPKDKQKDIKDYIKSKKFKFRGSEQEIQNEMVQVVRYYNTL